MLLKAVPAIQSLVVVDTDLRIRFASDKNLVDLAYTDPAYRALLSSDVETRRPVASREGDLSEVFWPIFAETPREGSAGERKRLGGVLVRYHTAGAHLENYATQVPVAPVSWEEVTRALLPFLVSAVMASVLVAAWTVIPVRRLVRAVEEYKARGFRGEIDPESLGLQGDLASAARAISEMAGRLDRLDARSREREALLETLTQSLEEGMVALGPDDVPVAWNAAAARLLVPSGPRDLDGLREAIRGRMAEIGKGGAAGRCRADRGRPRERQGRRDTMPDHLDAPRREARRARDAGAAPRPHDAAEGRGPPGRGGPLRHPCAPRGSARPRDTQSTELHRPQRRRGQGEPGFGAGGAARASDARVRRHDPGGDPASDRPAQQLPRPAPLEPGRGRGRSRRRLPPREPAPALHGAQGPGGDRHRDRRSLAGGARRSRPAAAGDPEPRAERHPGHAAGRAGHALRPAGGEGASCSPSPTRGAGSLPS